MYLGRIVEIGTVDQIFEDPKHPYTQALIRAIPEPDPTKALPRDLPRGEIPDAARPPLGCSFHPRCPKAFERSETMPPLLPVAPDHRMRCWLAEPGER